MKIRVLIVDDSVLFRSQIQMALKDIPDLEVVGTAANGKIALEKLALQEVDLVTMDIEMPVMDGLEAVKEIRAKGIKSKIILFSSLSKPGAEKTFEGLRLGATDFATKPLSDGSALTPADKIKEALVPKILALFGRTATPSSVTKKMSPSTHISWETFNPQVMVIASSTGGPPALTDFFANFKEPVPYPILITQHMPPLFTTSLASTLAAVSGRVCKEAVQGETLVPNQMYVAPGDFHMRLGGDKSSPIIVLDQGPQRNYVRPCADFLFESAARIFGKNTLGLVFTGMGRDGADGAKAVKEVGGAILIQNEASCVVFGMPGAVYEAGHFDFEGRPQEMALKSQMVSKIRRIGHVA